MDESSSAVLDGRWQFWIDRGGTFTDVVARDPAGDLHVRKLLSQDPERYEDAALHAMAELLGVPAGQPLPGQRIAGVRMGTTVATNALLERQGEPVCLVVTRGFADVLEIGYQNRPEIFALEIIKPAPIVSQVVEVDERVLADGEVRRPLDREALREQLQQVRRDGVRSLAVALVHGYAYSDHERAVGEVAREVGFDHVSLSHQASGEIKLVARGDTASVDAYLTPKLRAYVARVRGALGSAVELRFMQSNGGLADAERFSGKDAILSGPAGGVVAAAHVSSLAGFDQVIGFDMGGTSTDVSRWAGRHERVFETSIAGVRLQSPMLEVVTVAAGGGSLLDFDGRRYAVGPESAGADPGPACYRKGGPAAVTDANAVLGRIQPRWFPACFGESANQPLDVEASRARLAEIADAVAQTAGTRPSLEEVAAGFLRIANENMARPIEELSVARGYDVRDHVLCCFGGAGAQHACALARSLGIRRVLLHPLAGVLSAYGMGLADVIWQGAQSVLEPLDAEVQTRLEPQFVRLEDQGRREVEAQGITAAATSVVRSLDLRYLGTETPLEVVLQEGVEPLASFEQRHQETYGFLKPGAAVEVLNVRVEVVGATPRPQEPQREGSAREVGQSDALDHVDVWFETLDDQCQRCLGKRRTGVYRREALEPGARLRGPALVVESVSTVVVDPGWTATVNDRGHLVLEDEAGARQERAPTACDPVRLEVFNSLFMSVADRMGQALRRVSHSTNIKERLDFSCALFDPDGRLVANAPHIPVHLGAMGESVRAIVAARSVTGMSPGDVYVTNDPFHGGSHLPDVTVVTPVFLEGQEKTPKFFVANRGHHADIGGISPGSMPPFSRCIEEEGVVIHDFVLVEGGRFREREVLDLLGSGPHPARDPAERLSDLRSQVAANALGVRLLEELCQQHGLDVVEAYMGHVQRNAAAAMREVLRDLPDGEHRFRDCLDDGAEISVCIRIAGDRAVVDFEGTSPQLEGNLNAPRAVVVAAVLYVFRCLIRKPIPLNAGCLEPIEIHVPDGCLLNPQPPAAVVGGNVETSMRIVDVLFGALGRLSAGQGTMNNVTFGTAEFGYYETICGGAGAGLGFDGASAVHTHMTNTRITDVEVLERRYPVVVSEFSVRRGSGGDGVWRGGDGVRRSLEFREPMSVAVLSERRAVAPWGSHGADPGACGANTVVRADGRREALSGRLSTKVEPGDRLVVETPGAGGFTPSPAQWAAMPPVQARGLFRGGRAVRPTAGLSAGRVQVNLLVVPAALADDFEAFCHANARACPLLERLAPGDPEPHQLAPGADVRCDVPLYAIHHADGRVEEVGDLMDCWAADDVAFLLGCSFSFEESLASAGIGLRHVEEGVNVPMYRTSRETTPAGPFAGPLVVSMRPLAPEQVELAHAVTAPFARVHGAPLHHGDPGVLGIDDLGKPDFGDPVTINPGEVPVFWSCGVTSQEAVREALGPEVPRILSHAPGYMLITDALNRDLADGGAS